MLAHRLRRWTNIKLTLGRRLVLFTSDQYDSILQLAADTLLQQYNQYTQRAPLTASKHNYELSGPILPCRRSRKDHRPTSCEKKICEDR